MCEIENVVNYKLKKTLADESSFFCCTTVFVGKKGVNSGTHNKDKKKQSFIITHNNNHKG